MTADSSALTDEVAVSLGRGPGAGDTTEIHGLVIAELWRPGGSLKDRWVCHNLVTQVGDQMYAERAVGLGSLGAPTGMQLGTGATAAAKTGAGAATVTYISGSNQAFEGAFPASSLSGSSRRIQYQSIWAAGDATNAAIAEAVITNDVGLPDTTSIAADTISRVVFGSTIDKQAADTLTLTWNHDFLGA